MHRMISQYIIDDKNNQSNNINGTNIPAKYDVKTKILKIDIIVVWVG